MASIAPNSEFPLLVTNVEQDGPRLKIWGQIDEEAAIHIHRMMRRLSERFALGVDVPSTSSELSPEMMCCARSPKGKYKRAEVCRTERGGRVLVRFIDYGVSEVLPLNAIRILDHIPTGVRLQALQPLAHDFVLANTMAPRGGWETYAVEGIKKAFCFNKMKAKFHSTYGEHRLVKLGNNNRDFGELLISKNLAIRANSTEELFAVKRTPRYNQARALMFEFSALTVGSEHQIYVSHVEDGSMKFSVQVQSTSDILQRLMEEINKHPTSPLQKLPEPGVVCLGRYSLDGVLCRAVVMSVMEQKCKVFYVDFGHTEVLPYSDIFQLPAQYINPGALSVRCTLSGLKNKVIRQPMYDHFKEIVNGKILLLRVMPSEGHDAIQYGDVYDNGRNILSILKEKRNIAPPVFQQESPVFYPEPPALYRAFKDLVHVSFVESCVKFFVQLNGTIEFLNSLEEGLGAYAKKGPKLDESSLKVGRPCCALHATNMRWYRAQILSVKGDQVTVLYVDYGNEEVVAASTLRKIPNRFVTNLSPQAIRCVLNGFNESPVNQELSNQFKLLVLKKKLAMEVICVRHNSMLVDLFDREVPPRISIASKLRKQAKQAPNSSQSGDKRAKNGKPNPGAESLLGATNRATKRSADSLNSRRKYPRRLEKFLNKCTKYVR